MCFNMMTVSNNHHILSQPIKACNRNDEYFNGFEDVQNDNLKNQMNNHVILNHLNKYNLVEYIYLVSSNMWKIQYHLIYLV